MRPPDPFTPNLKVDLLPEITQSPKMAVGVDSLLPGPLQMEIDIFLHTRQNTAFPTELKNQFMLPLSESASTGSRYNISLMNALILYLGAQANAKVFMLLLTFPPLFLMSALEEEKTSNAHLHLYIFLI